MAKMLSIEEMIEAAQLEYGMGDPQALEWAAQVSKLGTMIANELAERLDIETTGASFDWHSEGGTLAAFLPRHEGQPMPACLDQLDPHGEWMTNAESAAHMAEVLKQQEES